LRLRSFEQAIGAMAAAAVAAAHSSLASLSNRLPLPPAPHHHLHNLHLLIKFQITSKPLSSLCFQASVILLICIVKITSECHCICKEHNFHQVIGPFFHDLHQFKTTIFFVRYVFFCFKNIAN
jgi:hypothetical protein